MRKDVSRKIRRCYNNPDSDATRWRRDSQWCFYRNISSYHLLRHTNRRDFHRSLFRFTLPSSSTIPRQNSCSIRKIPSPRGSSMGSHQNNSHSGRQELRQPLFPFMNPSSSTIPHHQVQGQLYSGMITYLSTRRFSRSQLQIPPRETPSARTWILIWTCPTSASPPRHLRWKTSCRRYLLSVLHHL